MSIMGVACSLAELGAMILCVNIAVDKFARGQTFFGIAFVCIAAFACTCGLLIFIDDRKRRPYTTGERNGSA